MVFLIPVAHLVVPLAPSPPPQSGKAGRRQCPVGLGIGNAAASAQHGVGAGELVGRGADVHAGVVEHEVVEVDELAFEPHCSAGIGEVGPRGPSLPDRALCEALVEPGECVLGGGERAGELGPGQRIGDLVAEMQGLDNLNCNCRNGS